MERLCGRRRIDLEGRELTQMVAPYTRVLVDLGTGDGRFIDSCARMDAATFALGIDACRDALIERSRRAPANALYLIANALALPADLDGLATRVTITFPWGTLLTGLLNGHDELCARLAAMARPNARLEVRLNAGALAEAGWTLESGSERVRQVLRAAGFTMSAPVPLDATDLRAYPSTWAHRLAFGRDPRAVYLTGERLRLGVEALGAVYAGGRSAPCREDA